MQQCGAQGLGVEVPAGEDAGDRQWMGDVGLAAFAELAFVGQAAEFKGLAHQGDFVLRKIGQRRQQGLKLVRRRRRVVIARRWNRGSQIRRGPG